MEEFLAPVIETLTSHYYPIPCHVYNTTEFKLKKYPHD